MLKLADHIKLYDYQVEAVKYVTKYEKSLLVYPTGSG